MEKRVEFKTKKGEKLVGVMHIPEGKPPFPTVIVSQGLSGYKDQPHIIACAEKLAEKGILAVRFDFTNYGESSPKMEEVTLSTEIEKLKEMIEFILSLKEVDSKKIGLTGHSLGALISCFVAEKDKIIKCIAPVSISIKILDNLTIVNKISLIEWKKNGFVFLPWKKPPKKPYKLNYSFIEDLKNYNLDETIKKISVPILFVHGEKDEIPINLVKKLFDKANEPKKFVIIKNGPHTFKDEKQINEVATVVADWFEKYLK